MKTSNFIFKVLHIIAWVIFVGLCIEACGLLVNFIVSIYKPEFIDRLYQKMNLIELYHYNNWLFYCIYSLILSVAFLKSYLFYIVIMLLFKLDLSQPFNQFVSDKITKISYFTFVIGILSYISNKTIYKIQNQNINTSNLTDFYSDSEAFILMAAIVYIIAVIFKKGIELQNENDLTI
jgi:hypothetical protein